MPRLIEGRRLVYIGGTSRKFWEWRLYESDGEAQPGLSYRLTFRWGRLGTGGQSMDEFFSDLRLAQWKAGVKQKEKLAKGYRLDSPQVEPPPRLGIDKPRREVVRAPRPQPQPQPQTAPLVAVRRVRLRE